MRAVDMLGGLPNRRITPLLTIISDYGGAMTQGAAYLSDVIDEPYTIVGVIFISPVGYHEVMRSRVHLRVGASLEFPEGLPAADVPSLWGDLITVERGNVNYVVGDDCVRFVPLDYRVGYRGSRIVTSGWNSAASGTHSTVCVVLVDFGEPTPYTTTGDHHALILRADDLADSHLVTVLSEEIPFPFLLRSAQFQFPTGGQNLDYGGHSGIRMRLFTSPDTFATSEWLNPPRNVGTHLLQQRGGEDYLLAEDAIVTIPFNFPVYERGTYLKILARNTGATPTVNATVLCHIERITPTERAA
jgi:hypothetical protein